jgi:hypothetical protein
MSRSSFKRFEFFDVDNLSSDITATLVIYYVCSILYFCFFLSDLQCLIFCRDCFCREVLQLVQLLKVEFFCLVIVLGI